ncbi:MAG TPA: cytochrome P450 [Oleiagrimonas sp.]|nr:cytochrome P450 [Oleiagrimonas sp.]
MSRIPHDPFPDSTLAFKRRGYAFIGQRCDRYSSDIFATRLFGRRHYCVRGADAARMFYEPDRFTRKGALPAFTLKLLQDQGSVATLDTHAHLHRKRMFMALMTPEQLQTMARFAAEGLRASAGQWPRGSRINLHHAFRSVLCSAACRWMGVPVDHERLRHLARECGAMIDNAGRAGPANWRARRLRRRTEQFMRALVVDVRGGRIEPPAGCALQAVALHRQSDGQWLAPDVAAAELINLLRPTMAIARFMTFAALALHEHPQTRARLVDDEHYREAFVQEVRRFYPFFPAVAGVAREAFTWCGFSFHAGDRFMLDLYGTDHDARLWPEPEVFRPERFLDWRGDAFVLIPQGGGEHERNHRCAGEWLTIAVMKAMLLTLARDIAYDVPPQDLRLKLSHMPALLESGFVVTAGSPIPR